MHLSNRITKLAKTLDENIVAYKKQYYSINDYWN